MGFFKFLKFCTVQAKRDLEFWCYNTTPEEKIVNVVGFIVSMVVFYYLFM